MSGRAARIVAVVLLAVASVEILEADRHAAVRLLPADCELTADGGVSEADDNCLSCAICEEANPRARLVAPATDAQRAAVPVDRLQPGICAAPYHPPR